MKSIQPQYFLGIKKAKKKYKIAELVLFLFLSII